MIQDDPRKLAKPLKKPVSVSYKNSRKNSINKEGGKVCRKNAMFQHNAHDMNPLQYLLDNVEFANEPRKAKPKKKHQVDPFMVRQAKLKAKAQQ